MLHDRRTVWNTMISVKIAGDGTDSPANVKKDLKNKINKIC